MNEEERGTSWITVVIPLGKSKEEVLKCLENELTQIWKINDDGNSLAVFESLRTLMRKIKIQGDNVFQNRIYFSKGNNCVVEYFESNNFLYWTDSQFFKLNTKERVGEQK